MRCILGALSRWPKIPKDSADRTSENSYLPRTWVNGAAKAHSSSRPDSWMAALFFLSFRAGSGCSHKETCEGCIVSPMLHFSGSEGLVHKCILHLRGGGGGGDGDGQSTHPDTGRHPLLTYHHHSHFHIGIGMVMIGFRGVSSSTNLGEPKPSDYEEH